MMSEGSVKQDLSPRESAEGAPARPGAAAPAAPDARPRIAARIAAGIAAILLAAPLLVLLAHTLAEPLPEVMVHGDLALIELATLKATRFEQVAGPYSRFKMHHPGPALFYWLAPFYQLGGRRYGALCLGILVLDGAAFGLLMLVPWRLAGAAGLVCAAPFLALLPLHAGPHLLWSVWNPDAGIFPLAASFAGAFAVAAGRPKFLPAGVFFGAFAAHCHVLYLAPAAAIWLVALAFALWRFRAAALPRGPLLAAAAIFLLMAYPVALEEWRGDPGNLSRILQLKDATAERSLGREALPAGIAAISEAFWAPLGYGGVRRLEGEAARAGIGLSAFLLLLAGTAAAAAWRRRSPLVLPALLCWLALIASALWTLASLSRPLHPYLTRFLVPSGPLAFLLLGCALALPFPKRPPRWLAGAAVVLLAATAAVSFLACREIGRTPRLGAYVEKGWGTGSWGQALPKILAALERQGIASPSIGLLDAGYWHYAAAIAGQVEKRGGHALVYEDWEFMFGPEHARGAHDGLLLLDSVEGENGNAGAPPPPALVVRESPLVATLIPLPERLARGGRSCIGAGDEDADLFLRSGFYPPEREAGQPDTRWSRYEVSRLSVRLVPRAAYRLVVEVSPYEAALPQEVGVSVGGERLAVLAVEPGWRRYAVEIPAARVASVNEVEFRYAKTAVPREVSASRDHRSLALRYRAICFEQAEVTPPARD